VTNSAGFQVAQAGAYLVACSVLSAGGTNTSGVLQPYIQTSSDGITFGGVGISGSTPWQLANYANTPLAVSGVLNLTANQYVGIAFNNTLSGGAISTGSSSTYNYFYMCRVA
jgi:hypothetical protein